jgi:hypothetical protein
VKLTPSPGDLVLWMHQLGIIISCERGKTMHGSIFMKPPPLVGVFILSTGKVLHLYPEAITPVVSLLHSPEVCYCKQLPRAT